MDKRPTESWCARHDGVGSKLLAAEAQLRLGGKPAHMCSAVTPTDNASGHKSSTLLRHSPVSIGALHMHRHGAQEVRRARDGSGAKVYFEAQGWMRGGWHGLPGEGERLLALLPTDQGICYPNLRQS